MEEDSTPQIQKPALVGFNHIALEVGNIDEALDFYQAIFNFKLRSKGEGAAFIDLGDQFLALFETKERQSPDKIRHFGLVVDNREHIRELAEKAGAKFINMDDIEFYDPWGNHIQIIEYRDILFSKTQGVLRAMGIALSKSQKALDELAKKGMM